MVNALLKMKTKTLFYTLPNKFKFDGDGRVIKYFISSPLASLLFVMQFKHHRQTYKS